MIKFIKTLTELKGFINWLELKKDQSVAFDTETTGLNPLEDRIILLQFGDKYTQYVIDVARVASPDNSNMAALFKTINDLNIICVMHEAKFDYGMVKCNYKVEIDKMMCTKLASKLLTRGRRYMIRSDLATTLKRHMGIKMEKEVRNTFIGMHYGDEISKEQVEYSGKDVEYLLPLLDKLLILLGQRGLSKVALLEFNVINVTSDMEINGALIDVDKWLALEAVALKDAKKIKNEMDDELRPYIENTNLFNDVLINYNSPDQIKKYFSKVLGFQLPSTGKEILGPLNLPLTNKLLNYKKLVRLSGTYGSEFLKKYLYKDGRIHSSFDQLGAKTGRYSSKNTNLQNIPADQQYRSPFIAPSGYKFISVDFSGRLVAPL